MKMFYTPNCPECMGKTDSESIQNAVNMAKKTGVDKVVIPRINERTGSARWDIDVGVTLPSDIQIVLDNCYIRQVDGVFDNVFRNENFYNEELRVKPEGEQRNIHINGIGNALIDGGLHNGITEEGHKPGDPPMWVNNMILMHNVDGFSITGIKMINQRWWAIHLVFCSNGLVENLKFDAKNDAPNQDGVNLRNGCNNITVKNIYGYCGDDVVALSGFMGYVRKRGFEVQGKSNDIHHVFINNIMACSRQYATVGLRNMDGIKLHDITVDGITDISDGITAKPMTMVRLGQKAFCHIRPSEIGETSRIFINNVHVNHGIGVMVNLTVSDSHFSNFFMGKDSGSAITTCTKMEEFLPGATMRNVTIDGIYCDAEHNSEDPLIELLAGKNHSAGESMHTKFYVDAPEYLENVVIKNINTAKKTNIFYSEFNEGYYIEK